MILDFFRRPTNTLVSAAIVVGVLSFASRLVGLLRDRILAARFGAGDTLDVYYAAFRIPDTVFALLVVGALSASFIPLFMKYAGEGRVRDERAWVFTNNVLHLIAIAFFGLAVVGVLFAEPLAGLIAPGFSPHKLALVVQMMRVMFLAQLLLSVSTIFGSVLQATKRFVMFALAPIVYNVGIILGVLVLVEPFGPMGLAWGVVLGALFHLVVSSVGVRWVGYKHFWTASLKDSDTREALALMLPRVLGLGVIQLQFVLLTVMASGLAAGSLAVFQLAYNLQYFPVGILGVSYAIAAFPVLSEYARREDTRGFVETFSSAVRQMLYFIIPASLVFLLLRAQIVRVVLGAGAFDWTDTIFVADTLALFALSFFAQAIIYILVRGYFAYKDSVTPLVAGAVSTVILLFASVSFSRILLEDGRAFGVAGLALAFSLTMVLQMALLWAILRLRVGSLGESRILPGLAKMCVAGLCCAVVMMGAKTLTPPVVALTTFWGVLLQGLFAGGLGLATYVAVTWALKTEEFEMIRSGIDRKIFARFRAAEAGTDL